MDLAMHYLVSKKHGRTSPSMGEVCT